MAWNPEYDIYKEFAMSPDRELEVWEDWMTIREVEAMRLGVHTDKPPIDLVANMLEDRRPEVERKIVLEHAQLMKKPLLRGGPWEPALRLRKRCSCDLNVYEVQRTAAELGRPKRIQHIQCPQYIQENEKQRFGVPERVKCNRLDATYHKYREEREEILKKEILKIDPFRSEIKDLVVIGRTPQPEPKPPLLPEIKVTEATNISHVLVGICALRVNDTLVLKNIPDQDVTALRKIQMKMDSCTSWTYYFNAPENKMARSKLYLENLGTVALRYCWKKIKKSIPFIPEELPRLNFFFNKNEDLISPGQSKTIDFTFIASTAGIFSEHWELQIVNTNLFENLSDCFAFHLVGDSVENIKKNTQRISRLENRIDVKAMAKYILHLLESCVENAVNDEHQIYPYKKYLLEKELFENKNAFHYYHQTNVEEMKKVYKEMCGRNWDLSIPSWRLEIFSKEFDERMNYYEQLKKYNIILLSPVPRDDDLRIEKFRAVRVFLDQLMDKFYDEYDRVSFWNGVTSRTKSAIRIKPTILSPVQVNSLTNDVVRNIVYIRMYEHTARTMEAIAGCLSSLDLNRWIKFDFCRI